MLQKDQKYQVICNLLFHSLISLKIFQGPHVNSRPQVIFCSLSIEVAKQDIMWTCFFMLSIRIRHTYIHLRKITYLGMYSVYLYCIPSILCRGIQVHFHILHAIYQCVQCAQRLARILNFSGLNFEKKKTHESFSSLIQIFLFHFQTFGQNSGKLRSLASL